MSAGAKLLGAGLTLAAVGYAGYQALENNYIPTAALHPLEELPPEFVSGPQQETLVCPADLPPEGCTVEVALGRTVTGTWTQVSLADIPQHVQDAVVVAEDREFYEHSGIDVSGAVRAANSNRQAGTVVEGASTIDRQLVSLIYPPLTNAQERQCGFAITAAELRDPDLAAQLSEGCLALTMNRFYTKDQILEKYLNTVYFGRGAVGIGEASQAYFGVDVKDLTIQQGAFLPSLIPAPGRLGVNEADSTTLSEENLRRYRNVISALEDLGKEHEEENKEENAVKRGITSEEADQLWDQPVELLPYTPAGGLNNWDRANQLGVRHFTEMVMNQAAAKLQIAREDLNGFQIHTTLNTVHQQAMHTAIANEPVLQGTPLDAAGVSVDQDGAVTAMVGTKDPYSQRQTNFAMGEAGGGSGRPTGSSNKTVEWWLAFEAGMQPDEVVVVDETAGVTLEGANNGNDWLINTAGGCDRLDRPDPCEMTASEGLAVSSNIMAALILQQIDISAVGERMQQLGVDIEPQPDGTYPASMIFGAGEGSPYGMTVGHNNLLVRHGDALVPSEPYIITKIVDRNGAIVYEHEAEASQQVGDREAAENTVRALNGVITYGTASGAITEPSGPMSAAGKTGTADDVTDTWFTGSACTSQTGAEGQPGGLTASFWIGNPDGDIPMTNGVSSYDNAQLWDQFMQGALPPDDTCQLVEP